jgi:hypothetical protein
MPLMRAPAILAALADGARETDCIAAMLGHPRKPVACDLWRLARKGLVVRVGSMPRRGRPGRPMTIWRIAGPGDSGRGFLSGHEGRPEHTKEACSAVPAGGIVPPGPPSPSSHSGGGPDA